MSSMRFNFDHSNTLRAASPTCPTNKRRPPLPSNLSGNGRGTSKGLWTRGCLSKSCKRADNGAQWAYEKIIELPGAAEAPPFFQEGCPDSQLTLSQTLPAASASTPFYGSGRIRAAVDRSKDNVGIHREQGGDLAGGPSRPPRPVRR